MVMDNHMASICAIIVNAKMYNGLPEDIRKVLDEAVVEAEKSSIAMYKVIEVEGIKKLQSFGLQIYFPTDAERKAWQTPIDQLS